MINTSNPICFLSDLPHRDVKPGLERVRFLLDRLGNPEKDFPAIHVAGSNGKGSTNAILSSILDQTKKVGKFISPPISGFRERITIDGNKINQSDLGHLVGKLKPEIAKMKEKGESPTLFETAAAMAAKYFSEEKVDLAILETGMGGQFDATKPIGRNLGSLITNIELEHADILGPKLEDIAKEIVGIAGKESPLILGKLKEGPLKIAKEKAQKLGCEVFRSQDLVKVKLQNFDWDKARYKITKHPRTELTGKAFDCPLIGKYQEENMSLALASLDLLDGPLSPPNWKQVKGGLKKSKLPGRFQLLSRDPLFLADGAHNTPGIEALTRQLKMARNSLMNKEDRIIQVFTALRDKNLEQMVEALTEESDTLILTELDHYRATSLKDLRNIAEKKSIVEVIPTKAPTESFELGKKMGRAGDLICATGSLYLVEEAIQFERRRQNKKTRL